MANENFTLTWHSYTDHFQEVLSNLLDTGESSDVTLICDDQVKFKAHKFILKSCSPVFENILNETDDNLKSVVYLRGVNPECRQGSLILGQVFIGTNFNFLVPVSTLIF